MKMNKKKLAVVALILCVAAIISLSSLAWFTATDSVENTLKFSTDFAVDLYETDEENNIVYDEDGETTIGQTYEDLMPGSEIHKDPTVVNKSSAESQYIRMTVTVDHYTMWAAAVTEGSDFTSIFTGLEATDWTRYDDPEVDEGNDIVSYTFYLNSTLGAGETATLFTGVTIPTGLELNDVESTTITVTADALQVTGNDADTTYAAFNPTPAE